MPTLHCVDRTESDALKYSGLQQKKEEPPSPSALFVGFVICIPTTVGVIPPTPLLVTPMTSVGQWSGGPLGEPWFVHICFRAEIKQGGDTNPTNSVDHPNSVMGLAAIKLMYFKYINRKYIIKLYVSEGFPRIWIV